MTRNQIIIAVLQNAIVHLWDGTSGTYHAYHKSPVYVCHAIAQGFAEFLRGDRCDATSFLQNEPDYGKEMNDAVMTLIPGWLTANGFCRHHGIADVQTFRLNMLKSMLATYQEKESKTVKASELARAAILKLSRPAVAGHPGCELFTCHAVKEAAADMAREGRSGSEVAEAAVKFRIAAAMSIPSGDPVGVQNASYAAKVSRLLGDDYVHAQPRGWMQERRADMLTRVANFLESTGN